MKDILFDKYGAIAVVRGKTGLRRVRLIWSMPYLAQWIEAHPLKGNRDSPLWIKRKNNEMMNYAVIRSQLKRIAMRAGVEKRVNPHNFRHSRATYLASRLTESQIEEYLGWVQGSEATRVYVHLSGRDLDKDLLKLYGLEDEEKEEGLKTLQCPHCKTLNTLGARICMNCRKPLVVEEVLEREARAMEMFKDFMDLVASQPEVAEKFRRYFDNEQ